MEHILSRSIDPAILASSTGYQVEGPGKVQGTLHQWTTHIYQVEGPGKVQGTLHQWTTHIYRPASIRPRAAFLPGRLLQTQV